MDDKYHYRLTKDQKREIAQNLIEILESDATITEQTRTFIGDWILTCTNEKRKAFFDVWDLVLKNYLPKNRPILFRACNRIVSTEKIASFTGRLECAKRFSRGKGFLVICDTKEALELDDSYYKPGEYRNTFYPLVEVLVRARDAGGWGFSKRLLNGFIGEDEYIMRINLDRMYSLKWTKAMS